jgi:alpha-1,2-mannosyltransferase
LLVQLSLRCLGWALQAKSKDRRAAIISRVQQDREAALELQQHLQRETEAEDGWETIEQAGTAENGKPSQDEWEGIVGFFHPFW